MFEDKKLLRFPALSGLATPLGCAKDPIASQFVPSRRRGFFGGE